MSKKFSIMLVLCAATLCLSGCSWFRETGPCLGMGCPGHSAKAPNTKAANAQHANPKTANDQTEAQVAPQQP
jgi:hypothetical protein